MEDSGGNGQRAYREGKKERKKERGKCQVAYRQGDAHEMCMWQLLALSRLVRSSLSFLPPREEGRQNAIEDSVTGSLSRF